jgi:hypothetical protein
MWDSWTISQRGEKYKIWPGYISSDTEWRDLRAICQFIVQLGVVINKFRENEENKSSVMY